jgi:hypothetical protein
VLGGVIENVSTTALNPTVSPDCCNVIDSWLELPKTSLRVAESLLLSITPLLATRYEAVPGKRLNVQDVEGAALGTGIEGSGPTTTGVEGRGLAQAADHRIRRIG